MTAPHDTPEAIEAMARAMCICEGECFETRHGMMHGPCEAQPVDATAALTALCSLRPDVAAVLRGEAVALPKTPTDAQWDHISASLDAHPASLLMERQRRWWPDLVAASPYAQETPDAR